MIDLCIAWFKYTFAGIWPLIWHFGLGGVIVLGCVALYAVQPAWLSKWFPNIQKILIWVAALTVTIMVSTGIGVSLGEKRIRAQWDAALISEVDAGEQARSEAVATVRDEPPDSVRNDPRNRDNFGKKPAVKPKSKVRWLASHRLFGGKRQPGNDSGSADAQSNGRK